MPDITRELRQAFEDFKRNHGESLEELRERLDSMEAKSNTIPKPGGFLGRHGPERKVFEKFLRKGDTSFLESKALNVTTDSDGGYLIPEELAREIVDLTIPASPMRGVCNVIQVGSSEYRQPVGVRGIGSGWVGEDDERPETNTPSLAQVTPYMGEIFANPAATQTMLDDSFFNVSAWLAQQIADEFAIQENAAFVTGNGTKKPRGFLDYTYEATGDATRDFGKLEYLATGVDGAFKTFDADTGVNPADDLITLVHMLKAGLRQGASWMLNSATLAVIRKWKDGEGRYIWTPSLIQGQPDLLLGYPIVENEDMPDVGSGAMPVVFGNFKRGYTIVDRNTRLLRDPYTNKPYVHFYTTKRVGGMVVDSEAIKAIKTAAS